MQQLFRESKKISLKKHFFACHFTMFRKQYFMQRYFIRFGEKLEERQKCQYIVSNILGFCIYNHGVSTY